MYIYIYIYNIVIYIYICTHMHLHHTASSPTSTIRRPAGAVDPPARGPTRCHPTSIRSRSDNPRPPSEIGHLKNLICKMWLKNVENEDFHGLLCGFCTYTGHEQHNPKLWEVVGICRDMMGYVEILRWLLSGCVWKSVWWKWWTSESQGIHGYRVFDGTWTQFFPGHPHLPNATEQRTTSGKLAWSGLDGPKRLQRIRDVVKRLSSVVFHEEQEWGIGDSEDTLSNGPNTQNNCWYRNSSAKMIRSCFPKLLGSEVPTCWLILQSAWSHYFCSQASRFQCKWPPPEAN